MTTAGPYRDAWYIPVNLPHDLYADAYRRVVEREELLMTQVSGTNPTLYTNYKKKGAKKAPKK